MISLYIFSLLFSFLLFLSFTLWTACLYHNMKHLQCLQFMLFAQYSIIYTRLVSFTLKTNVNIPLDVNVIKVNMVNIFH